MLLAKIEGWGNPTPLGEKTMMKSQNTKSKDLPLPERYTQSELRKVGEALALLREVSPDIKQTVWNALPRSLKMEYNWCRWR